MKIALGSDHAGFKLKESIKQSLIKLGHDVIDCGTHSDAPVDYPDFSAATARALINENCERAIIFCGSGVGASISANKIKGIRAAICHDTYSAHQGVEHDDMNILVLGARIVGESLAQEIVQNFLSANFSFEERHVRRLQKILELEKS